MKKKVINKIYKSPLLTKFIIFLYNFLSINIIINKGKKNKIKKSGYFKKKTFIKIKGSSNFIDIKEKSRLININIKISGNNNRIVIGENSYIKDTEIYVEDDNNEIYIGENTTIMGKTHLACIEGTKITIGKDCMFSTDIVFRTGDSHSILDQNEYRINHSQDIFIGNHVWIGNKNIVVKGAIVSDNSVIGTNSLVTKQFHNKGVIIAGTPAKIIKSHINWSRERN